MLEQTALRLTLGLKEYNVHLIGLLYTVVCLVVKRLLTLWYHKYTHDEEILFLPIYALEIRCGIRFKW